MYGWLFDDHGRVLVQQTPDGFSLPGGSPEPQDGSLAVTLAREALEESQVLLSDTVVLGHERPQSPVGGAAAYVRAAARVTRVLPRRPDPDGRLLGRVMVAWPRAVELLAWGPAGAGQGHAAAETAGRVWGLPVHRPSLPDAVLP